MLYPAPGAPLAGVPNPEACPPGCPANVVPVPTDGPLAPKVVEGGGKELTDGFVGVVLDSDVLSDLGLLQLSQPRPGPVLLQPLAIKQGKHNIPAWSQERREKIIRMANSSFLEQVGGDLCGNRPAQRNLKP